MSTPVPSSTHIDPRAREFYREAMKLMDDNALPFLVGGAYAFARYTGIERHTKDFDVFLRRADFPRAQKIFQDAGYRSELTFTHWIGKAYQEENFVDLIFSAGNGVAEVDELWFSHAVPGRVVDMDVKLIPAEEMIWSKGLIMERERYDGGDVAHVLHAVGDQLDWRRLIDRYGQHWRALYTHAILFGYIYPSYRGKIPTWVMSELGARLQQETDAGSTTEKLCYGPVISRQQFLIDINDWGYRDARLKPLGNMTADEIERWTAGIAVDGHK